MLNLIRIDNARMNVPEPEYFTAGGEIKIGDLCKIENGKIMNANSEADIKEFVALSDAKDGDTVAVCRLTNNQVWEATFENSLNTAKIENGATVNFSADSIIGAGDEAVIVDTNGAKGDGDTVYVRFRCLYRRTTT
jgi:hypothetical protein